MPTMCRLITVKTSACSWWCPTTMYPLRFITDTITPKLASAAITADGTPGRSRISRSGAAGAAGFASGSASSSSSAIVRGSGRMVSARNTPTRAIADAANQGTTSVSSSRSLPAKSGRKTSGPSAAPKSAPKSTYEIARARRSGGYMSAAAVRASRTAPFIAPTPTKPRTTAAELSTAQPTAVSAHPAAPIAKPPAITVTRPIRSISRPAGRAARAPAVMKIAGPRPRIDSMPVTRTRVIVATATASWRTPERTTRQALRRKVLRRTGCARGSIEQFNHPGPELPDAAAGTDAERTSRPGRSAPAVPRANEPPARERTRVSQPGSGLRAGRPAVRGLGPRMSRHDVPEEDDFLELELAQHAVHDRRGRLGRADTGQLALRRERDAGDAGPAIPGRLADEQDRAATRVSR